MPETSRLICLAVTFLTMVAASGCKQAASDQRPLTPVRTSEVEVRDSGTANTYSANIQPYAQVDLAFKSSGYIVSIQQVRGADGRMRNVDIGDRARKGTVLATVQEDEFKEKLSQAKAQLARAQSDYDRANLAFGRTSTLFAADAVTKPDYDNANAQLQSTQASIDSAKASVTEATIALGYCQLRVPFDSWVLKRSVDVGSLVGPATNGFSLADTRSVKVVFGVPDTMISRIKLGSRQSVSIDAVPGKFEGRVTAVSPAADPKSRVYSVEVTLPNASNRLKSGMIASIAIGGQQSQKPVPVVPLSAVVRSPDDAKRFAVFVVDNTDSSGDVVRVRTRDVTLGDAYGNVIAVLNGVGPGERVVTSGATMIRNGDQVRVIP
jgi:RND family efflux transporter MFP subunit